MIAPKEYLSLATAYNLLQGVLRGNRMYRILVEDYVHPQEGDKVLDIGCGTAIILNFLPEVSYTGFDVSQNYINHARQYKGDRGDFHVGTVDDVIPQLKSQPNSFNIILVLGVIHHLNDPETLKLMETGWNLLKQGGRLITLDGCYVPNQSRLAKFLIDHDRGEYVRNEEGYKNLALKFFKDIQIDIRHDIFQVPYTACILSCRK